MYQKMVAINFGKVEHKWFGVSTFLGLILISFTFCMISKPYMSPPPILNWQLSRGINFKMLSIMSIGDQLSATQQTAHQVIKSKKFEPLLVPICNFSGQKSDFCEINGDIRIQGNSSSVFFTTSQLSMEPENNNTWSIKLYARKTDKGAMGKSKELSLKPTISPQEMPKCTITHTVPCVIFSAGGYAGNFFHDFSDVLIPLYLTSAHFNGEVQFLLQNKNGWWTDKFDLHLKKLSKYETIDLDNDNEIRCFRNTTVGLKSHKDFDIDPEMSPKGYSLANFTQFLRQTYSLKKGTAIKLNNMTRSRRKARLLIISRKKTRTLLNEDELAAEARTIGYHVEIIDAATMELKKFANRVNSFDVMVGVHGAGLTNMVFLPENAVLIQVVPVGTEWLSENFFQNPTKHMNIKYLEYKISENESSLIEKYSINDRVFTDPDSVKKEGWLKFKSIYLESQNVRVDVSKFKTVLLEALQFLHQ